MFYAESGQDWHHFAPLVLELTGTLGRRVTYVTSDPADPGLLLEHERYLPLCIPQGWWLIIHFQFQRAGVVVLTMMDLDRLQLKRSINPVYYIYVFHSMGSTHMVDHASAYDAYDSLFCVGPHHVRELRRREELAGLPPRHLFAYGYPRLEELLREGRVANPGLERPAEPVVLVAPTWGDDSIFNRCGGELMQSLLDAGMHVIMRPHYQTRRLSPGVLDDLIGRFAQHPRFELVEQMGEKDSLLRSDLLVSDWSAMAIEYALGLEKPVLFIDLPRRIRNPDWRNWDIEPFESAIRSMVGEVLDPADVLRAPQAVQRLLEARGGYAQRIRDLRPEVVFNPQGCVTVGAREIARLAAARRPHKHG